MQDVIARLGRGRKIFPRREHATTQKFFPTAVADLLGPVHPTRLAQAKKVPRRLIRGESQVVEPKQHHARSPVRPLERRFSGQSEISYPFVQSCAVVGPPQELPRILPVQRGNPAFCLQHFARPAVDFPADVESKFRLDAHRSSAPTPSRFSEQPSATKLSSHRFAHALSRPSCESRASADTPRPFRSLRRAGFCSWRAVASPPRSRRTPPCANAAIGRKCWPAGNASASPARPASATSRIAARSASRRRARRAAFAAQSARVPFRKFFASSLRLPSRYVFTPRQETLLWSRAVRRRAPHLRHRPESTPYGPDPRNPPRKHCKRALLLSRRRHFSRTLRRASRTEQQSAAPPARVFHIFPQRITLSLFLTLFPKC